MSDSCPTPEKLQQWLEATLSDLEWGAIEPHLETCQNCRAALDGLTQATGLPALAPLLLEGFDSPRCEEILASTRYRFVRYHKGGGTSDVVECWDEQLDRPVALKLLRSPHNSNTAQEQRFHHESRITAKLAHPGIVPIHALAQTNDGRVGCVMAMVQGETLHEAIRKLHSSGGFPADSEGARRALRPLLSPFVALCNIVAYAHSQRVLHGDIKPGNVILGIFGETVLLDWGMGREFDHPGLKADGRSEPGGNGGPPVMEATDVGGTFGFMSPEHAACDAQVGPAADIYSLGATLYCVLTGQAPLCSPRNAAEWAAMLSKVRTGDFAPPRKVNPNVQRALEAICLKALACDPSRRYADGKALALDVDLWLTGEPVHAWREPWWQRGWRRARKHRVLLSAIAAAIVVSLGASALAIPSLMTSYARESRARTQAQLRRVEAEAERVRAQRSLKTALEVMDSFLYQARTNPKPTGNAAAELRSYYIPRLIPFYKELVESHETAGTHSRQYVGRAHHGLAVCFALMADRPQAEQEFFTAQAAQEALLADSTGDPGERPDYAADLAVTLFDLAQLYREWGRQDDAAAATNKLSARYESFSDKNDASRFAYLVAMRFGDLGQYDASILWQGKAIEAHEIAVRRRPDRTNLRNVLAGLLQTRALCRFRIQQYATALQDWERRAQLTSDPLPASERVFRAGSLARERDHLRASAEVDALASQPGLGPDGYYDLACALAVSVPAARDDPRLATEERAARAEQYARGALRLLRQSQSAGFFRLPGSLEHFKQDADFNPLRSREDFKQFEAECEKNRMR
jgi:tRNA A-37 threonylcarbamoyl transferase component Bud32